MAKIELVVFDVAGTTATDDGLVVKAFTEAMVMNGAERGSSQLAKNIQYVEDTMGQRKMDVFLHISGQDKALANKLHESFIGHYNSLVEKGELKEFEGITTLFSHLHNQGVGIALTTGFPRTLLNAILRNLNWRSLIDLSVASDEVTSGRPSPDMIFRAMDLYANLSDQDISPEEIAVVGDTESDMQSGVTSGARYVIGVTSGAHSESQLRDAGATHVLELATQLLTVINR